VRCTVNLKETQFGGAAAPLFVYVRLPIDLPVESTIETGVARLLAKLFCELFKDGTHASRS
jgi:hypothetical protein